MLSRVVDVSQVAEARRVVSVLARKAGFDDTATGRVALVATEMATNLLRHAGGGSIAVQRIADADGDCLELVAFDGGPGIADTARALQDGFSTAGSAGTGLGAIRRQAARFEIWSKPGLGTAVMARFPVQGGGAPARQTAVALGAITEPYPGETVSGDAWVCGGDQTPTLMLVDGSGHGPNAASAAEAAVAAFSSHQALDCVRLAQSIHAALKPTRGGAIGIARIDREHRLVRFVGIGNISAAMLSGGECRRMVSHHGVAGHVASRVTEFTYPYTDRPTVILHSDGLSAKWDIDKYVGLATSHPSLIAAALFDKMRRERDDACIAVMQAPS